MSAASIRARARASRGVALALAAAIALGGVLAWRWVLDLALIGWDAYPLIAASRLEGTGDLLATFGEELMDGRYPLGHYWRPLVHLSFALDHARWGIEPSGFHATDLALFAALALATFALVRALAGRAGAIAAPVAALTFALHPAHVEWLTAPARRADALALLFTLLALRAQLAAASGGARWRWLAAIACALALASKEIGAAAAPLALSLALCASNAASLGSRLADAVRRAWPSLALAAATFAARCVALDGLGGPSSAVEASAARRAWEVLGRYAPAVLSPPALRARETAPWVAAIAVLALAVVSFAALALARKHQGGIGPARAAAFLALGFALLAAITAMSGVERGWYELAFLWLHAALVGLAVGFGAEAIASGARATGALAITAGLIGGAPASPTLRAPPEIERGSELTREFLARFDAAVGAAPDGTTVRLDGFPMELVGHEPVLRGNPRSVTMLAPYSLEAYAELAHPGRKVRLGVARRGPFPQPRADEVVVLVGP